MDAWIPITIAAAGVQTLRFLLQRHLKLTRLSTAGATFARFIYSAPAVAVIVWLYSRASGQSLPHPSASFFAFALSGGLAQILATMCVIALFARRNFAVGLNLQKSSAILSAFAGWLILDEAIPAAATGAILLGFAGVVLLSDTAVKGARLSRLFNRTAGLGLAAGALFAISAVGYRGASLSLDTGNAFLRAGTTLAVVTTSQMMAMALWLRWKEPGQVGAVLGAWRVAGLVGLTSMVGSFCWFTAYALQNAAYVNAVGQIELVFGLVASVLFLREKVTGREVLGMALLMAAILWLIALD